MNFSKQQYEFIYRHEDENQAIYEMIYKTYEHIQPLSIEFYNLFKDMKSIYVPLRDFYIDKINEIKSLNKQHFVARPSKYDLKKRLYIAYKIHPFWYIMDKNNVAISVPVNQLQTYKDKGWKLTQCQRNPQMVNLFK